MVKKILPLLFLVLSLFFVSTARAQQAAQTEVDRYVCLNAVLCSDSNSDCSIKGAPAAHRVKITTRADSRALPNKDTYIIECLQTKTDRICTTGNAEVDNQLFKKNTGAVLADQFQYKFDGMYQSDGKTIVSQKPAIKSSNIGAVGPYEWESFTVQAQARKFYAFNRYKPEDVSAGSDGGQQQGTFSFENVEKKCIAIHWDPYGRVFDSQTLEPIPGSTVTLFNGDTGGVYTIENGYLENPQTTLEHGGFSFIVPNGNYKLSVALPDYLMTTSPAKLQASYSKIYSDLYDGGIIRQNSKIEHRDIAMESLSGGKTYPVKMTGFFKEINKFTGKMIIDGFVSHPFTKIKFYSYKPDANDTTNTRTIRYKTLSSIQADKEGQFKAEIDQSTFESTELCCEYDLEKVSLTSGLSMGRVGRTIAQLFDAIISKIVVHAQEVTTGRFDPVPNYLEGYAYDSRGQAIPNATVGVYLTFSESPYYQMKADSTGYFKITSENLPYMSYKVRYTSSTGIRTDISTGKFVAQNAKYVVANKILINSYKDSLGNTAPNTSGVNVSTSAGSQKNGGQGTSQSNGPSNGKTQTQGAASNASNIYLLIIIVLVFLGVAGLLLAVYVYNKNKTAQPPMM